MLQEAIEAIRQGQKGRARDLLGRLLRSDPNNAEYWLWMSGAVTTSKEQIFCLQNVLRLDPENKAAKKGLILLGVIPPEADQPPAPAAPRDWKASIPESTAKLREQAPSSRRLWVLLSGLAVILIVSGALWFWVIRPRLSGHAPTTIVLRTQGPLPTYTPTPTMIARATDTLPAMTRITQAAGDAVSSPPTLASLYTPTPLYVNTPHPVNEAYRIGLRAFAVGDWQTALTNLQQAAAEDPAAADIQYYIGECLRNLGDEQAALNVYQQTLKINVDFAPAYLGRARTRWALNPNADILDDLQKAIAKDPNYGEAYIDLASYYLATGEAESAWEQAKMAEKILPQSPLAHLYKGQAALLSGENQLALQSAQRTLELDQTLFPAQLLYGQAALLNGELEQASEMLRLYTNNVAEDPAGWLALGETSYRMGLYADALTSLDQALDIDDRLPEVYLFRGLARLEMIGEKDAAQDAGQDAVQDAVQDLATALRYLPKSFDANLGYGRALLAAGRLKEARDQLNKSEGLVVEEPQMAAVFYWRARTLEQMGNPKAASTDWKELLDLPEKAVPAEWAAEAKQRLAATPTPAEAATKAATPDATATATFTTPTPTPTTGAPF